jgi:hypothetical protein
MAKRAASSGTHVTIPLLEIIAGLDNAELSHQS